MKPRSLALLLVAGTCGLVAAFAAAQHLSGNKEPQQPVEPHKQVVVAKADQEVGTTLTPDMLEVVELAEKGLPEGTFSQLEEVTGQALRIPIFKGEPVLASKLGNTLAVLISKLPEGMKAGTVRVAEQDASMEGLINPGNHVDVHWLPSRPDLKDLPVLLLLQDVEVLAVGQRIDAGDSETPVSRGNQQNYTLKVTSEQYSILAVASSQGKIRLALRGKGDKSVEAVDEIAMKRLLGLLPSEEPPAHVAEAPTAPPAEAYEVEVFEGPNISNIKAEVLNVPENGSARRPKAGAEDDD